MFNYFYAILHSQSYRDRYAEFLKLGFPRVQITGDRVLFKKLTEVGEKLVGLHTLAQEGPELVAFDVPGDNVVERVLYVPPKACRIGAPEKRSLPGGKMGRVYINAKQYFEGVTPAVWQFRIGGYQVCEKWLKDRKGRTLGADDIEHYQRTVSALAETRTLMAQIDSLIADHGGWPLS
ncbi:MAG: type ISP restriction/modification enzyme [Limisphaerales bacterium]